MPLNLRASPVGQLVVRPYQRAARGSRVV